MTSTTANRVCGSNREFCPVGEVIKAGLQWMRSRLNLNRDYNLSFMLYLLTNTLSHKGKMLDRLFNGANLFVLPFWALIILLPNWLLTRQVMKSNIPYLVLAGLYLYLFVNSITSENAQALSSPQLADIARAFADEKVMATGWIHYLVMDLFVGRWIYWEGQRTGIWTFHSLALCLFAGPLGLLSHILTSSISQKFFTPVEEKAETVSSDPSSVSQ